MKEFEVLLDYSIDNTGVYLIADYIQTREKYKNVLKFNFTWVSKKQEQTIIDALVGKDVIVCVALNEENLLKLKTNNSSTLYSEEPCFTSWIYSKWGTFIQDTPSSLLNVLELIEDYCTWNIKSPKFPQAMFLSEYYWKLMVGYSDPRTLAEFLIKNSYDIDYELNEVFVPVIKQEYTDYLKSIPSRIHQTPGISLGFINKFQYMFGAIEMLKGHNVIVITDSGEVQIRTQTKSLDMFNADNVTFRVNNFLRYNISNDLDSRLTESQRIVQYLVS